jgi:hypothetical protein
MQIKLLSTYYFTFISLVHAYADTEQYWGVCE